MGLPPVTSTDKTRAPKRPVKTKIMRPTAVTRPLTPVALQVGLEGPLTCVLGLDTFSVRPSFLGFDTTST